MTRDEFVSLPPSLALGLLWDEGKLAERLASKPAPQIPRPPKYDDRIFRKGGFQWVSETDLDGLIFWHARYVEGANKPGNEYAEKDAKRAKSLEYWIAWRRVQPHAIWSGERFREPATAAAPSDRPTLHQSDRGAKAQAPTAPAVNFDDDGTGADEFGDLPFA